MVGVGPTRATDRRETSVGGATSVVDVVLAGALAAVAGAAFLSAFRAEDLLQPVVVAAAVGVVVSLVATGVLKRSLGVAFFVAVAALGGVGAVVLGEPGTWVDGYYTIVTSAVPVPSTPAVRFVPFAITGVAAFLGGEVAQRTRSPLAPVLPSLVALVLGLGFGMDGRPPQLWVPSAWVGLTLLVVGWRTGRGLAQGTVATTVVAGGPSPEEARRNGRGAHASGDDDAAARRRVTANAVRAVLVVAVLAVPVAWIARSVGPQLPGSDDDEGAFIRERYEQPAVPEALDNPLVVLTGLQAGPDDGLFVAETSGPVERWRWAVLDAYDGVRWSSQGSYLPAGVELPGPPDGTGESGSDADDGATPEGARVTQTIQTDGLEGRWLPVADRAVELDAPENVLFDASTGVLVAGGALPGRYEVVSRVPQRDAAQLGAAAAANDDEAVAALELPGEMPPEIRATVDQLTQGAATAYDRAVAIEQFLAGSGAEPFQLAQQDLPSGQSWANLHCLLHDDACARSGSTEQFVAAYAVMARAAGLPTRIVVGFDGAGAPGRDPVTAHEATAWAEVKLEGIGWVAFDPVPDPNVQTTPPTTALPGSSGGTPDSQPATTVGQDIDAPGPDEDDEDADERSSSGSTTIVWLAAAVGVVVGLVLLPGVLRARRRRRRRRAHTPADRVAGAWAAVVDELRRGGVPLTRGLAVSDVVMAGRHRFAAAAEPLAPLGVMVNRFRFGRIAPGDAEAEQAWQLSDTFTAHRRRSRPLPRRLREYFALRT